MINSIEQFGRNAGKVWDVLNNKNLLTDIELSELTSLREYELYIAIGWLARENKIRKDGEYYSLKNTNLSNEIGQNADSILKLLTIERDVDVNDLINKIKIDEKKIFSAIGWLARENKIKIKKKLLIHQTKI